MYIDKKFHRIFAGLTTTVPFILMWIAFWITKDVEKFYVVWWSFPYGFTSICFITASIFATVCYNCWAWELMEND